MTSALPPYSKYSHAVAPYRHNNFVRYTWICNWNKLNWYMNENWFEWNASICSLALLFVSLSFWQTHTCVHTRARKHTHTHTPIPCSPDHTNVQSGLLAKQTTGNSSCTPRVSRLLMGEQQRIFFLLETHRNWGTAQLLHIKWQIKGKVWCVCVCACLCVYTIM